MKHYSLSSVETHSTGALRYYVDGVRVSYGRFENLTIQARMHGTSDCYHTIRTAKNTKHCKSIRIP